MLEEIIKRIKRPFKAEVKSGFLNISVFGGFDKFILYNLEELKVRLNSEHGDKDINELLKIIEELNLYFLKYRTITSEERKEIIRTVIPLIQLLDHKICQVTAETTPFETKNNNLTAKNFTGKEEVKNISGQNYNVEKINNSIKYVKGIGPKRSKLLNRLGIERVLDLLYFFPREYSDRSQVVSIDRIKDLEGEVTIKGEVVSIQEVKPRRGMRIVKVAIHDESGLAFGVWFNQPYVKDYFQNGDEVIFSGKVNKKVYNQFRRLELNNPVYEKLESNEFIHTRRIVPIYPLTEGLTQKIVREVVKNVLQDYLYQVPDLIPENLIEKYNLLPLDIALKGIHFPENKTLLDEAKRRMIFEDFFFLQMGIMIKRKFNENKKNGFPCKADGGFIHRFIKSLPFKLTNAQERVWSEISSDMQKHKPMHRLLQGDVGSGKTVIAAMTLIKGIENGLQGVLMAPTEILAEQHYLSLRKLFEGLELRVELLTGSLKKKMRDELLEALAMGKVDLVIGTHALIQEEVQFKNLGVVVIDEQHRFGVNQRELLRKKGLYPHVLVMTATPIPRSLALTIYGDLDLSIIDELPPGRKPIKTVWRGPDARPKIYDFVKNQLNLGRQAYVVCPLIDESEVLQAESAREMATFLSREVFSQFRVGLLTGQTPQNERDCLMSEFRAGKIDVLVATTVIEVGVDVPNATIMIIEDAQRFGLAQLHQLRGRVGRGDTQSYCILIGDATTPEGERRLEVMVETNDGFKIAEEDLAIRGPGEFFGTRQHGLPELKIANLIRDWEILEIVRREVKDLVEKNPEIINSKIIREMLELRFKSFLTEEELTG